MQEIRIVNVSAHKWIMRIVLEVGQGYRIAGISEIVKVDYRDRSDNSQWEMKLKPMKPQPPVTRIDFVFALAMQL